MCRAAPGLTLACQPLLPGQLPRSRRGGSRAQAAPSRLGGCSPVPPPNPLGVPSIRPSGCGYLGPCPPRPCVAEVLLLGKRGPAVSAAPLWRLCPLLRPQCVAAAGPGCTWALLVWPPACPGGVTAPWHGASWLGVPRAATSSVPSTVPMGPSGAQGGFGAFHASPGRARCHCLLARSRGQWGRPRCSPPRGGGQREGRAGSPRRAGLAGVGALPHLLLHLWEPSS